MAPNVKLRSSKNNTTEKHRRDKTRRIVPAHSDDYFKLRQGPLTRAAARRLNLYKLKHPDVSVSNEDSQDKHSNLGTVYDQSARPEQPDSKASSSTNTEQATTSSNDVNMTYIALPPPSTTCTSEVAASSSQSAKDVVVSKNITSLAERSAILAKDLVLLTRTTFQRPKWNELQCLTCRCLPTTPVTGRCGHSRCMRCTIEQKTCPCGVRTYHRPRENIQMRDVLQKMSSLNKYVKFGKKLVYIRKGQPYILRPRVPLPSRDSLRRAYSLVSSRLYTTAVPLLVRIVEADDGYARDANRLLKTALAMMIYKSNYMEFTMEIDKSLKEQSVNAWLKPGDLECVLCTNTFREPVSTPCGHTFCRFCIKRTMAYRKKCALCSEPLETFVLSETRTNQFFSSFLNCMDVPPLPLDDDVVPLVISYVAFPNLSCPLFIKNLRQSRMVMDLLKSGSRRFGLVSYERHHPLSKYGVLLEICDCVLLENNSCIVSTVGVSRFKVVDRDIYYGYNVARIMELKDIKMTGDNLRCALYLAEIMVSKIVKWLERLKPCWRDEIETAFGVWPLWQEIQEEWWNKPDGPAWLWWIIAILPLTKEGKVNVLKTQSILPRIKAVLYTFDAMDELVFSDS